MISGLYETLIDETLERLLETVPVDRVERRALDPAEGPGALAQHLGHLLARALARVPEERRVTLCNRLIERLTEESEESDALARLISRPDLRLMAVHPPAEAGARSTLARPETPLSVSSLLTGTRADPSLVSQLQQELRTADNVDILCSFIKWSGVRVLQAALRELTSQPGRRLRVITTSYMGATDIKAVEFLRSLPNTEIKVSYDTQRTRLHAKAYLFSRGTGFGTAYIGSSNLSHAALTDGLEWNLKVSQFETAHLWDKVTATFETYWNDEEFSSYRSEDEGRLRAALAQERQGLAEAGSSFFFDVHPYPYQQAILDRLEAERTYSGQHQHLVVAATGTGKTVIAALDYRRFQRACQEKGGSARLLFVAHRQEILEQSRACFRAVLRDANFGDLLVGHHQAQDRQHLFVSVQSYESQEFRKKTSPEYYDYVVIDEAHHVGAAKAYRSLVNHVRPQVLIGLTATPERADGESILDVFGGRISAEIRLPAAINQKLLSPFQYFGVTDIVDLSTLTWRRREYDPKELERAYTGNDARAHLVADKVREILLDPLVARGLGFCVSVAHARYMAEYFTRCGLPSMALSAESDGRERSDARRRLVAREVNFLFVVDLYNEGVDIPEIDTVLFLRPTQSLTVFLQQLGRGLRLCAGKDQLTVLDFIGQAHQQFSFEVLFRALLDRPKRRLDKELSEGSMPLPAGCTLTLERQAQEYILDNIRKALDHPTAGLKQRLRTFAEEVEDTPTLGRFLRYYEMEPDDLYRRTTWTALRESAGLYQSSPSDPDRDHFQKGLRNLEHWSGPRQIAQILAILREETTSALSEEDRRLVQMLHVSLWKEYPAIDLAASLDRLRRNPVHRAELIELLEYRRDQAPAVSPPLSLPFLCPLELHAAYAQREILTGLGYWTPSFHPNVQAGVLSLPSLAADVFFVTLNKSEADYSPTTMYADYAINERFFHWQSQSVTSEDSATGQRYIHHGERGHTLLLFVREDKMRAGLTVPYVFLGPARYRSHTGSRPMSIKLELEHPIPAWLLPSARRLAAG